MRNVATLVSLLTLALFASDASAQDDRQVGLVIQNTGSVGFLWNATSKVAIRPEFSFSFSGTDSVANLSDESSGHSFQIGISGLLYLRRWNALRTYISPQYSYGRSTFRTELSLPTLIGVPAILPTSIESTATSHGVEGMFGAQYGLHERFAVFGEVGFGYSRSESPSSSFSFSSTFPGAPTRVMEVRHSHTAGTRGNVGVIFYF